MLVVKSSRSIDGNIISSSEGLLSLFLSISLASLYSKRDNVRCRDIFGREASIIGAVHKPKCLLLDECVFDIAQSNIDHLLIA